MCGSSASSYGWRERGSMGDDMGTENREVDPAMLTIIRSLIEEIKKVEHVFQQLMDMKEERKVTSGRVSIRLNRRN